MELKTAEGNIPDATDEGQVATLDEKLDGLGNEEKTEEGKEGIEGKKVAQVISDPNARVMYLGKEMTLAEAEKIYKGLQGKNEKDKQAWTKESESLKGLKQLDTFLKANPEKAKQVKAILEDLAEETTGVQKKWFDMSDEEQVSALEELVESREALKSLKGLKNDVDMIKTLLQNAGSKAKQTEEETQLESEIKENVKRLKLDTRDMKDELSLFWEILGSAEIKDEDDISTICDMVYEKITNFSKNKIAKYVDGKKSKGSGVETTDGKIIAKTKVKVPFDQDAFNRKLDKKFEEMET